MTAVEQNEMSAPWLGVVKFSELATSRPPVEKKIMAAAMMGYFDDSRTDGRIMAVAGLVGDTGQWDFFERRWETLLDRHGVPYLHMTEMASPSGPFARWLPPEDHKAEVQDFFVEVTNAINDARFDIFGTIVRLDDLAKFNSEKSLSLEPYALAVYGCMAHIKKLYDHKIVDLVFDRIEKVESRLIKAREYAEGDISIPGIADFLMERALPKRCTFRNIRPMQAADFIAWEMRKHHIKQSEWWELGNLPDSWEDRFTHFKAWSNAEFGTNLPPARQSIAAVARHRPFNGSVLDYRALCIIDEARNGNWSVSAAPSDL